MILYIVVGCDSEQQALLAPTPTPTVSTVVFQDTFEAASAADYTFKNNSTGAGNANGTITGGSMTLNSSGAAGVGNFGAGQYTLSKVVPLKAGDYELSLDHKASPNGSITSRNFFVLNGVSNSVGTGGTYATTKFPFTMAADGNLSMVFQSQSGDDSGLILPGLFEVREVTIDKK